VLALIVLFVLFTVCACAFPVFSSYADKEMDNEEIAPPEAN
jgi:hypothetical protein